MKRRYLAGDVLTRRKGLVVHKGIALGGGRVLHNTPSRGEHISSEAEFLQGQSLQVIAQSFAERSRALAHAQRHLDGFHFRNSGANAADNRSYNLFTNNCEHTVSRARSGHSESPQLKAWVAGISLAAVALVVTRHPAAIAAGFTLGKTLGASLTKDRG